MLAILLIATDSATAVGRSEPVGEAVGLGERFEIASTSYLLTDGTWAHTLTHTALTKPQDAWLSIAETFELLAPPGAIPSSEAIVLAEGPGASEAGDLETREPLVHQRQAHARGRVAHRRGALRLSLRSIMPSPSSWSDTTQRWEPSTTPSGTRVMSQVQCEPSSPKVLMTALAK